MTSFIKNHLGLLIIAGYGLLLINNLGTAHFVEDDESREVGHILSILDGNILLPRFNGWLIPDKPTLFHWLGSVSASIFGFSEFSTRLISVLCAVALTGSVLVFGQKLYNRKTGLVAAAMLASSLPLYSHARVARPDLLMILLLFGALCFAYLWWTEQKNSFANLSILLVGLSILAKGPVGPAIFVAAIICFAAWEKDLLKPFRLVARPAAIAAGLIGSSWYILSYLGWGEEFVNQHLIGRYVRNVLGESGWNKHSVAWHLLFYPKHLLLIALPWTPFILAETIKKFKSADPKFKFLACSAIAPALVFSFAEWKLRYYLLPALPPLCLIGAPAVLRVLEGETSFKFKPAYWRTFVTVVFTSLIATVFFLSFFPENLSNSDLSNYLAVKEAAPTLVNWLPYMLSLLLLGLSYPIFKQSWKGSLYCFWIISLLALTFFAPMKEVAVSDRASFESFAQKVNSLVPQNTDLRFFTSQEVNSLVVYAGRNIPVFSAEGEKLNIGDLIITRDKDYASLLQQGFVSDYLIHGEGRVSNTKNGLLYLTQVTSYAINEEPLQNY